MKRSKIVIIVLISIIVLVIGSFCIFVKPELKVFYDDRDIINTIEVNYNENFIYPKVKAKILNIDLTNKVIKSDNINTSIIGEYNLKYTLKYLIYKKEVNINVKVIDKENPTITLNGNNPSNACSVQTYIEEGYTAYDNYDKDITNKVTVTNDEKNIIYSVKDSSNNETIVKREIISSDKEAPTIKLNGNANNFIQINGTFNDSGVTVTDNCDTKITKIEKIGKVDTSKTGSYELIYRATDSSGNTAKMSRFVYVYDPTNLNQNSKGVIYLTFDDGPSSHTSHILDVLKKYGIKATFFVTMSGKDSIIKREYNEGHTVALHTASHVYKTVYSTVDGYFEDLNKVQNRVYKLTGEKSTIVRFPGGSSNTVSRSYKKGIMTTLTKEVLNRGYHYFDWNVSVEDAGGCTKKKTKALKGECVFNNFKKRISKNKSNVVLMHDIKSFTSEKLENMIQYALSQGYTFDKITMETKQVHHRVNN